MKTIATLTMNPTIDVAYEVERMFHTNKMRTRAEHYCPGGGGINVARVFVRLGGHARCIYLAGGATGDAFDGLVDLHRLVRTRVRIAGHTRIATAVFDRESGKEYRFTPQGPTVSTAEWQACLDLLEEVRCDIVVASGSLPPGVPADFYARAARRLRRRGIPLVLDSSGAGLKEGLAQAGGVMLVKPSRGELEQLAGRELATLEAIAGEASGIVARGQAELVAVTLGHRGALLASKEGTLFLPAIEIEARSAVGAGDSFLASMIFALAKGCSTPEAFRQGIAGGAAAVLDTGTGLAHPNDIARMLALLPDEQSVGREHPPL